MELSNKEKSMIIQALRNDLNICKYNNPNDIRRIIEFTQLISKFENSMGIQIYDTENGI
jgi:hypothetical protein